MVDIVAVDTELNQETYIENRNRKWWQFRNKKTIDQLKKEVEMVCITSILS